MKFKLTLLVPQEQIIDAPDVQAAHNLVTKMLGSKVISGGTMRPILHSIIPISIAEFGPPPAESA